MKLSRLILFACAAVAFALVGLVPVGELFRPSSPFIHGNAVEALTSTVTTDVMTLAVLLIAVVAIAVLAFVLGRLAQQRHVTSHFVPWRLSEPYRRTSG